MEIVSNYGKLDKFHYIRFWLHFFLHLFRKKEYGTNLKISFATDSRINSVQKSDFSEIKKNMRKK